MKITAIVAEYNPFHNGHAYHIKATLEETGGFLLAIMSGNFVQRGEPALLDKWTRTRMALNGGADLVIELPAVYATASAEYFAAGAIDILNGLGCVDRLSFGAESEDLTLLRSIAKHLAFESSATSELIRQNLGKGLGYAAAREAAVRRELGESHAACLKKSNNILAVEYLKALYRTSSQISPLCVKRRGAEYTSVDLSAEYPSALGIRTSLYIGQDSWISAIPSVNFPLFSGMVYEEALFLPLLYRIRSLSKEEIASCRYVSEGLENNIVEGARRAANYHELLSFLVSRRFPLTRVKRILLSLLLGLTREKEKILRESGRYARVLGVKKESIAMLSQIASSSRIPLFTSPLGHECPSLLFDVYASDIYALLSNPVSPSGRDYQEKFILI